MIEICAAERDAPPFFDAYGHVPPGGARFVCPQICKDPLLSGCVFLFDSYAKICYTAWEKADRKTRRFIYGRLY